MQELENIINDLTDSNKSLTTALLKVKVLATRIKNSELLNWVGNELNGYSNPNNLPEYRKYLGTTTGTYIYGNHQYNNQPVVTFGLDPELETTINSSDFYNSIQGLENIALERKGELERPFPAEVIGLLQDNWGKHGAPGIRIINCKRSISINAVVEVLASVRNKLLDFVLKFQEEFGDNSVQDLQTKNKEITYIMSQTIINTQGDGNVINTGKNSSVKAEININKGNKDELKKSLQNVGIQEGDIVELLDVVDAEQPNIETRTFGENVRKWTKKMR